MSCVLGCSHGDDELLNFNSLHIFFFVHFPPAFLNFAPWVELVLALLEHLKPLIIGEMAENYQAAVHVLVSIYLIFFPPRSG